jgi:hypothetical protein
VGREGGEDRRQEVAPELGEHGDGVRRVVRAGCPVAEAGVANVEAGEVGGEVDDTDVGHGHGGAQEIGIRWRWRPTW